MDVCVLENFTFSSCYITVPQILELLLYSYVQIVLHFIL